MMTTEPINFRSKTLRFIQETNKILGEYDMRLTVRQIYYRLVSAQLIENTQKSYKSLDVVLSNARRADLISYGDITDRTRQPIKRSSWSSLGDYLETVKSAYRRSRWASQRVYLEVWLEKEALANIFERITNEFDIYLVVGRGYQSLSALYDASERFNAEDRECHIVYFGDFDPTGEDIPRSIQENLSNDFDLDIEVEKVAVTQQDIAAYNLPPNPTKKTDSRTSKFVSSHGDVSVELDALPPDVLREKIRSSIERYFDKSRFDEELSVERTEIVQVQSFIEQYQKQ